MAMTMNPSHPTHPAIGAPRKRRGAILSFVLFVLTLPAMVAGLVVAVGLGYTLGPVLNWRQGRGVLLGALVASTPALIGCWLALRARASEQPGSTVALSLNGLVVLGVWLVVLVALFM